MERMTRRPVNCAAVMAFPSVIWSNGPSFCWPFVHVSVSRIESKPASFALSMLVFANA